MKNFNFKSIFLLLAFVLSIGQVRADITFTGGYVYFDNTNTAFDDGVIELVAHQWTGSKDYIGCTTMNLISGTNNLYYVKDPNGSNWGGIWGWRIMSNGSAWGSGNNSDSSVREWSGNCTGTSTTGLSSNYSYLCYGASSTKNSTFTVSSLGNSSTQYTSLNYTQTLYQCVAENGGSPAKSTASIGTISITTKKLNGRNSTTNDNGSITSGQNNVAKSAARTATVTMSATDIADGYTFLGWYTAETGGTRLETSTTYTYQASATKTVYARFSHETTHSVDITYKCGSTTVSTATSQAIGQVTASAITAPTVTGYTFSNWSLGSGMSNQSANTSANPISVKTLSSGNYTMQANYTEDLTTPYVINGGSAFGGSSPWWNQEIAFTKKSGESTGSVAYAEIPISTAITDGTLSNYEFKVVNGSTWYGLNGSGNAWVYNSNSGEQTLVTGDNIRLNANVVGTYIAKIDYSTPASPKITITWPVALSIYRSNPNDATNVKDHAWSTMPTATSYRWALDLEANTTYEFKINDKGTYYGSNTDITTTISSRTFSTGTNDTKLITKSAGRFTFTWDASAHKLTVQYPKSAAIDASPASVYDEGTTTLTGYASELGSGSHTITYEFYKGTTLTDANKIATKSKTETATYQQETQSVTVDFDGNATSQVYTIQIKEGGSVLATNTVTVYRKWDIYVHDVASWGGMYSHMWGNGETTWPGNECSLYNGSSSWYAVTIDAKYPRFQLNCNNCTNTMRTFGGDDAYTPNISTFTPGSYWYTEFESHGGDGHDYYTLHSITLSNPTVTLSASIANCKDITLTGNVTNCGNDGAHASDMKEVYFQVAGTKNSATTVSSSNGTFTKTLSSATAGTTNTLQAFAENIYGTGSSSTLHYTNVTLDRQSGTTGTTAVTAVENMAMPAGATAPGRTGYTFGGYYASTGGSGTQYYNASMGSANNWDQTSKDKTIYAKWTAKTYDVILDVNGGSGSNQTVTATYAAAMPTTLKGGSTPIAARTRTGYNFDGYTANNDGTGTKYYTSALASNHAWDIDNNNQHIYAKWVAKQSAITFDYQTSTAGYSSSGDITNASGLKGTYGSAMTALTGTMPSAANGYAFMGFYTETGGNGTKYYNADGSSATSWAENTESGTTLYAYYKKAEITNITFSPGTVVENNSSVTVTATISPTPTGTTTVCWRVLHNDTGNPLDPQPTFTPSAQGTSVSFTSPNESGMYKVEAVLHTGSGCAGTDLDTREATFQVAGSHTVTVAYKYSGTTIKASTSVTGRPLAWSDEITAPDIFGYSFSSWSAGDGITITDDDGASSKTSSSSATIKIKATYNGTLTANYTLKNIVYFKDNLGWTDPEDADAHIYVNLLTTDRWNDTNGSGNSGVTNRNLQMDRVPGTTDIFYYEYGNKTTSNYISFTKESMASYDNFYQAAPNVAHVVFPSRSLDALGTNKATGLGFYAATPMFVPLATQTPVKKNGNRAEYYNDGYWTKYLPGTGYSLDIYQSNGSTHVKTVAFTSADELMPMKVVTDLEGSHTYKFQLKRDGDVYYGNSGTMTYEDHGQNTAWEFNNSPFSMCTIVTNAAGEYTFNLSFSPNNGGTSNRLRISVDYPVANGDYRLIYTDNTRDSGTRYKPSAIVNKENNGTAIVSFFVRHNNSPVLRIQQATVDNSGNITWNEYPTSGTPTNQITGSIASAITKDTVYNFNLSMNGSGALSVSSVEYYSGNYYIRTDAANSKWDNYRTDPDHLMTYSEYSITHGGYSHYYTHWVNKDDAGRKNVKFCIANDYSPCISDTLARETASGTWAHIADWMEEGGDLKRSANVRFMWNIATNTISRAYVDGAQENGSEFLLMLNTDSPNKIKWADGTALTSNKVTFSDNGNWIYETNIKAQPNAKIKLKSTWGNTGNAIVQYFKGTSSEDETLIGGSETDWYDFRLIYDFKTNRLVTSYIPSGNISNELAINADVMFIREHQGDIAQLTFSGSGKISKINTAYGVMRFSKWTLNNKAKAEPHSPLGTELSRFERDIFYISFPFRVNLEEVFGFGTYGTHWIIEEYDGAERASKGFWAETETFWKFITNRRGKFLEPNTGYILALDLDELGESSSVWANTDVVELYFPSYGTMPNITASSVTHELPEHTCTIGPRFSGGDDRRMKDSHWNVMSVPTYINTDDVTFANTDWITTKTATTVGPQFLYTWNMNNNTLTATSGTSYTYKAMHAYMVQYCGNVTWTTSVSPALAPRRSEDAPTDVEFRLELQQNEQKADQAFIKLSYDEHVTTGFNFNYDLSKEMNGGKANIYTMITSVIDNEASVTEAAGNVLPMTEQTTVVPVGVKIATNGDYTFSLPEGTDGVGVTLIDTETGIRTSLSALDYTVSLEAGTYNDRFLLEISPIQHVATELETSDIRHQQSDVRKLLIDGLLYIVRDGKMFDARGARVE